jgi:hypothetical protein
VGSRPRGVARIGLRAVTVINRRSGVIVVGVIVRSSRVLWVPVPRIPIIVHGPTVILWIPSSIVVPRVRPIIARVIIPTAWIPLIVMRTVAVVIPWAVLPISPIIIVRAAVVPGVSIPRVAVFGAPIVIGAIWILAAWTLIWCTYTIIKVHLRP